MKLKILILLNVIFVSVLLLADVFVSEINVSSITFSDGSVLISTSTLGGGNGGRTIATKIVAASDSQNKEKADYICDGTHDEAEINAAINALPTNGGVVYLLEGTYNIGSPITIAKSNVSLIGSGKATILKRMWSSTSNQGVITVGDGTNAYEGIFISQLQIDGNRESYTNTDYNHGILFNQKISKSQIKSTWIYNNGGNGIYLYANNSNNSNSYNIIEGNNVKSNCYGSYLAYSSNNTISGNIFQENSNPGIFSDCSSNNIILGNIIQRNNCGVYLIFSSSNTIIGNTSQENFNFGIQLAYSSRNNTIMGNTVQGNFFHGIYLAVSNNNTITGNKIHNNGSLGNYDGIRIENNSDANLISSNDIINTAGTGYAINIYSSDCDNNYLVGNRYSGPGASSIRDIGTGTIYGAQLFGNASNADLILKSLGNVKIISNGYFTSQLTVDGLSYLNAGLQTNSIGTTSGNTINFTNQVTSFTAVGAVLQIGNDNNSTLKVSGTVTANAYIFKQTYTVGIDTPTVTGMLICDNNFNLWISTGTSNAWDWKKISQ